MSTRSSYRLDARLVAPTTSAISRRIASFACVVTALLLAGCDLPSPPGFGSDSDNARDGEVVIASAEGADGTVSSVKTLQAGPTAKELQPDATDAARFLAQATFGPVSTDEVQRVSEVGYQQWLAHQLRLPAPSHLAYVEAQSARSSNGKPSEDMSYEAIWQQWLYSEAQLRARTSFALSQIFVVSNVAPDLNARAMSSYMDMLNRNAFANYRQLLEEVTLHPAMGYYLNMIESEKEDPAKGTHPNENFAREVLQLFSIGLVKLNLDGTPMTDEQGKPIPTYDQSVVAGFAKAFSGWSFGGRDTSKSSTFRSGDENWTVPMQAWASKHSTASKQLFDGRAIPAGQTPQQDLKDALDAIFLHPNVGPFIAKRLIQRFVTSNPSPAYVQRVATAFNDNGAGVRGDLGTVVYAILTDPEARTPVNTQAAHAGKQREPVIRFANLLRAMNARSSSGHSAIHELDSADNALGQSPLLAPSVFNFYSPDYRNPGAIAAAGLDSPEFQITTETTVVGTLNFFANLVFDKGYGRGASRLELDFPMLEPIAGDANQLIAHVDMMFMAGRMTPATRTSFARAINSIDPKNRVERIQSALVLTAIAPEFVIQR
ncbi:MAG: DUF1800 family protein [Lautropia sp.]